MGSPNIELSKSGIKFSYNRFLADSAAGFLLILIVVLVFYTTAFKSPIKGNSKEVTIFIFLFLFLLSTPIGLSFNAFTWAFLGCLEMRLTADWVESDNFLIRSSKESHQFEKCKKFYGLSKNNWHEKSHHIRKVRIGLQVLTYA